MKEFPLSQKVAGFEEKETQRQKKDECVHGGTEEHFPQKGPDFSARATSNALCGFPCAEKIVKEEAGSDDQKNPDGNALYQFFS